MKSPLADLLRGFAELPVSRRILESLRSGTHRKAGGLWGASAAALLAVITRSWSGRLLIVTGDDDQGQSLADDLLSLGVETVTLPAQEHDAEGAPDPVSRGARTRALIRLQDDSAPLVAGIEALLHPAPAPRSLRKGRLVLRSGERCDRDDLVTRCVAAGLRRVPVVLAPGEVSARGDVVDVYAPGADRALRLELLDEELESIRTFDPGSQRSLAVLEQAEVVLGGGGHEGPVVRHLSTAGLLVVHHEPLRVEERAALLSSFDDAFGKELQLLQDTLRPATRLDLSSLPSHDLDYKILSAGSAAGSGEADPVGRLRAIRGMRGRVLVFCRSESERDRLAEIFAHKGMDPDREQVDLTVGAWSRGFRVPDLGLTAISNVEFAGVPAAHRVVERPAMPSKAIASFFELGPGDLVVHAVHGIARFEGMELVERGGGAEDHLRLCFRDDVLLLVPASKVHLVQKYVGAGGAAVQLDKLGGRGFQRRKEQVQQALFDLAADLLDVQARRQAVQRPAYPPDGLEEQFLDGFPFNDTDDQVQAWKEIGADLEKPQPMDRLLCGDVGFGKTEIALRAAFRVALHGRQVAVLVPTTLLAEQHHRTFRDRFAPMGLRVELLSRHRSAADRKAILGDLLAGRIDVLVGTHRILNPQVEFADLGLVVVDEEQRFGVRHKEHLKKLRVAVDVLTLSATPIPRTLHGSLLGLRSISTLTEPPPGRQDVETRLVFKDQRVMQDALQRELSRGGQVFVLHNRIADLELLAQQVRKLAPGARVAIGHGRMTERETEKTVRAFVRGDADVLVCTTIVENGLDLPRANTMLIDRADQFGLAELHQLRGRVGRSEVKAFCYLMMDREKPPGEDARKRLKALEEFSHLGAGFAIAMKDLEIRGAGNLLGPQQSGHIASVGYEMYCRLLRQAVEDARQERPAGRPETAEVDVDLRLQAYLPHDFLGEPKARLELLREMDEASDDERMAAIESELNDRFGKLPAPVTTLLRVFRLKHGLQALGVLGVQWVDADRLVVRHPPGQPLGGAWLDHFADVRPVEAGKTHLMLPPPKRGPARRSAPQVLDFLLTALSGAAPQPNIGTWRKRGGRRQQGAGRGRS